LGTISESLGRFSGARFALVGFVVVVRTPNGSTAEYRLCRAPEGLRLVQPCASYDLAAMIQDAGWRIVKIKTFAAGRLLQSAGFDQQAPRRWKRRTRLATYSLDREIAEAHTQ
jgi:hypothetical protein